VLFFPFPGDEAEADTVPTVATMNDVNELSFCFAGLVNERQSLPLQCLEELMMSKTARKAQVELKIDGGEVWRMEIEMSSNSTCWVSRSAYINVALGLFNATPGLASISFFNGRAPLTGAPEDEVLNCVLQGLLAGKMNILTRTEPDPNNHWRRIGEWQQTNEAVQSVFNKHTLIVVISMYTKDGDKIDGSGFSADWQLRLTNGATSASSSMASQLRERERQRKRQANLLAIRQSHAAQTSQLLERCMARALPNSELATKGMELIRNAAYHGENTVAQALARIIQDMCK
jgi:hypothetical protein